jgi:hypothetical protein
VSKYGSDTVTKDLVADLKKLTEGGLDVARDGGIYYISCQLLLVLGDNLAQHQVGGFF